MTRPSIPTDCAAGIPPLPVAPARASGPHAGSTGASALQAPPEGTRQASPPPCITAPRGPVFLAAGTPDPAPGARLQDRVRAPGRGGAQSSAGSEPDASSLPAGQARVAAAMSEDRGPDSLDAHVRRYLKDLGLRGFHAHDARRSEAGYPDWTIVGVGGVLFRELKTQRGKLAKDQMAWANELVLAGADWDTWRPEDLLSGRVARELTALAGLRGVT